MNLLIDMFLSVPILFNIQNYHWNPQKQMALKAVKFWVTVKSVEYKLLLAWLFSCINKNCFFFCQGNGYLWPHCCMNNLYISHRSLYAPTYRFWPIGSTLISRFRVSSWFDTVYNIVTHWMNFRKKKNNCMNMNYNYPTTIFRSIFSPKMYEFLIEKIYIFNFCLWSVQGKVEKL